MILSENAQIVLKERYLRKDGKDTPEILFRRVAHHVAQAETVENTEEIENVFYTMMASLKFLPNSPTLMNAGNLSNQLAACFVLPIEDNLGEIFTTIKNTALIHKSGGGTGFSFSRLRPKNSIVGTTGNVASGPISFMKIFNTATEQVKQGGMRRGANMAVLRVDHPDIQEFIECKDNLKELNNFNISVGITDVFMKAVRKDENYLLVDPRDGKGVSKLKAQDVYKLLVHQAWKKGDPGVIFLDRIEQDNPTPLLGKFESVNPCGEQPLLPMEACNLGSINLSKFVGEKNGVPSINFESLKETVRYAIQFLDNVIDVSTYPLPEIEELVLGNRKIGLGVMGFADMLFQLQIPYDSEEALKIAEKVMDRIQQESKNATKALAHFRGTFPNFDKSIFRNRGNRKYRNATTTTIAPTGSISIIAGCSSGIEPLFALSFTRQILDNSKLVEVNPYFEKVAKEKGFYTVELMERIGQGESIQNMEEIPVEVQRVFKTAHDIAPEWHVRMQATFQKYVDNAVSKTVNLKENATEEDVLNIFNLAFNLRCKGVTVYRDGSRKNQTLVVQEEKNGFAKVVKERPETLEGFTSKMITGLGTLYVTVTEHEGRPFELFATIGKSGNSTTAKTEAIGRLISLAFRAGVGVDKVIEQLKGIGGEHPIFQEAGLVLSIPDAISRILEKRYLEKSLISSRQNLLKEVCPECGQAISFEEGCIICHFCGYTKCG